MTDDTCEHGPPPAHWPALGEALLGAIEDSEHDVGDKVVIMLRNGGFASFALHGWETEQEALAELLPGISAVFEAGIRAVFAQADP